MTTAHPLMDLFLRAGPVQLSSPLDCKGRFSIRLLGVLWVVALMGLSAAPPALAQSTDPGVSGGFSTPSVPQPQRQPPGVGGPGQAGAQGSSVQDPRSADRLLQPGIFNRDADRFNNSNRDQQQEPRRPPRPEPLPTEFQNFVQGATGRMLPIFGREFFNEGPLERGSDGVPVAGDYTVGPGDELLVRVWGSIDADLRATVDRNGLIHLPRIGSFTVAGTKSSDLEPALRRQISRLYTNFSLNVTLGQLRGVRVFVVGAGTQVGVINLPSPATMLSAIVAAGGPNPTGSMRRVLLKRGNTVVSELDLYDLLVAGDRSKDTQLNAGDVIVFESAGPRVALTGSTDRAAIYELKPGGEPLGNVLRYAGGAPVLADRSRVQLERVDPKSPKSPRQVMVVSLDGAGSETSLRDGDVLTLLAMPERFANAVTLRGPVANPVRYPFTPGMRIRDLIPDRDALVPADFVRRRNELVQVEVDPAERLREAHSPGTSSERQRLASEVSNSTPAQRFTNANQPSPGATAPGPNSRDTLVGATRNPLIDRDGKPLDDSELAARSRIPTPLFNDLNWDYAVVERLNELTLSTEVLPFNLGRAVLHGDPEQNLALKPGDVVTIYSQRDLRGPLARQTRLVTVDGEVHSPGVYQLQAGETLRGLVQRAGGVTQQAYLYGLEFSRESTRQQQRQNLASAISRLEALAATQSARDAANRRDDNQSGNVSSAATQAQLSRLRQLQPNGRIALELAPSVAAVAELPDVPLEHGDRVTVPPRPGFVTVAGAVVNSNAFLWKADRTAGDYLKLAGVEEAADPKNTFILRADGTVTTAADNQRWFRAGLEGMTLQPGDAVIVPNQLDFETFGRALVRNLKDWSQILANFGIGAAAIKTLRQ